MKLFLVHSISLFQLHAPKDAAKQASFYHPPKINPATLNWNNRRVGNAIKSPTGTMHFTNSHCGLEDEFNSKQLPNTVQEDILEITELRQVIPYPGYYW